MKKITMVALLVLALATFAPAEAHAQYADGNALGGSINFRFAGNAAGGLSFNGKHESLPLLFNGSLEFGGGFGFNVGADYWIVNDYIGQAGLADVYWYWGLGATTGLYFGSHVNLDIGARMPIGLSWIVGDRNEFEIFTEAVLGLNVLSINMGSPFSVDLVGIHMAADFGFHPWALFNFGVNAGLRYWL